MPLILSSIVIEIGGVTNNAYITAANIILALYGVWNLDFFRTFYSDLCLGLDVLPTLALDYVIAVYPLLLMIITYLLVVLHDRNYRVITIMWKPFRVMCSLFRRNWNVRTSIIDAFATFFFLSNIKFLSVSLDFLIPTQVFWLYPDLHLGLVLCWRHRILLEGAPSLWHPSYCCTLCVCTATSHAPGFVSLFSLPEILESVSLSLVCPTHFCRFLS